MPDFLVYFSDLEQWFSRFSQGLLKFVFVSDNDCFFTSFQAFVLDYFQKNVFSSLSRFTLSFQCSIKLKKCTNLKA